MADEYRHPSGAWSSDIGERLYHGPILFRPGENVVLKGEDKTIRGLVNRVDRSYDMHEQVVEISIQDGTVYRNSKKEQKMDTSNHHKVTVIHDREHKAARVYVEVSPEEYLTRGLEPAQNTVVRDPGEEMPIWATIPEEIFLPMIAAGRDEYKS